MPGLTDIKPVRKSITVGEIDLEVGGISIDSIRLLLGRFPDLWAKIGTGMTADLLVSEGPVIAAAVIAAACGEAGNAEAEASAAALPLGIQAEILSAAINITMPHGPDPFVALLKSLGLNDQPAGAALSAKT